MGDVASAAGAPRGAVERALTEADRTGRHWRYLCAGKAAHALQYSYGRLDDVAACGVTAWPSDWLGTGSQVEYERAATLPRCRRCIQKVTENRAGK